MTNAPSWAAVYALLKKQKATYAKGTIRENTNEYTAWAGMNGEPFCFIGVSWTLAHAGESEAAGLALIGGLKAYVPYIRQIPGYRAGHSGMRVGAVVAVNGFEHIGFCTAISGSTFELFSFNTTHNGSDDAVWPKTYSLSSVAGHVNPAYGTATTTTEGDDMGVYVSVDKNDKSRKEALEPGKFHQIYFNQNNSKGANANHSKGDFPSFVQGDQYYRGHVKLQITGLPRDVQGQARVIYIDAKTNAFKHAEFPVEFRGSDGDTYVTVPADGYVPKGQKARIEVATWHAATVHPQVIAGRVRLFVQS
jgi:hypothetical protein